MKQAIIDIGSNSMRLTVYEIDGERFRILFKEKIMTGLAGYVEHQQLSQEGIERAYTGLLEFKAILQALDIQHVSLFATASLRNIKNTSEALLAIKEKTGYDVEVITGKDEAILGYSGAIKEVQLDCGAFIDIGGASTEIVQFENSTIQNAVSLPIGSLSLYKSCVKYIIPKNGSQKRIKKTISTEIKKQLTHQNCSTLVCVGGTARAVLRIAKKIYHLPPECSTITKKQFNQLCDKLYQADKKTIDLILKLEPSRVHTLIPGVMILQYIASQIDANTIIVSNYGVREGYLCQRIIK